MMKDGAWWSNSWNPLVGTKGRFHCHRVSEACTNCWAAEMNRRFRGPDYTVGADQIRLDGRVLMQPLCWRKPRRIFVCSMTDLFHEQVSPDWIDSILEVMAACPQHTFICLTKRPERMEELIYGVTEDCPSRELGGGDYLPNVWFGVTAENQERANERIPHLVKIPAKVRWVSVEPMLGPVDLTEWLGGEDGTGLGGYGIRPALSWVVGGGEATARSPRPTHPQWARDLRDQCQAAGVAFWWKQWGSWCHVDQMHPDVAVRVDAAVNLAGNPIRTFRVGKKAAGRLLDDREWSEQPAMVVPTTPRPVDAGSPFERESVRSEAS